MLMPRLYGESLFDDFFGYNYPVKKLVNTNENVNEMMKTDIRETENSFELEISVPGFKKENLQVELKDGYLTVSGSTSANNDETDKATGKYIRRERFYGSCSRSFYVGEEVKQEDIKAKYENGVLSVSVPKKEAKPQVEQKKFIDIEG